MSLVPLYYSKYIIIIHDTKRSKQTDMKLVQLYDLHIGGAFSEQDVF